MAAEALVRDGGGVLAGSAQGHYGVVRWSAGVSRYGRGMAFARRGRPLVGTVRRRRAVVGRCQPAPAAGATPAIVPCATAREGGRGAWCRLHAARGPRTADPRCVRARPVPGTDPSFRSGLRGRRSLARPGDGRRRANAATGPIDQATAREYAARSGTRGAHA